MDRYLERMDFRSIATTLAVDLQRRNYAPAKSILTADLAIVVHWGVTQRNENTAQSLLHNYDLMRDASVALDEARDKLDSPAPNLLEAKEALNATLDTAMDLRREKNTTAAAHERSAGRTQTNVELLGLQSSRYEADQAVFGSNLGDTLRDMINEERYFIILVAYDGPAMREGRKKRLWTTRASIRAAGVNFAIALRRLSSGRRIPTAPVRKNSKAK